MENKIIKTLQFLALGIVLYPLLQSLCKLALPLWMVIVGDPEHPLVKSFEQFTWLALPAFSICYLVAFHHLAALLKSWQKIIGYVLILVAVVIEIVVPFFEASLLVGSLVFIARTIELSLLGGCLLFMSTQLKHSSKKAVSVG